MEITRRERNLDESMISQEGQEEREEEQELLIYFMIKVEIVHFKNQQRVWLNLRLVCVFTTKFNFSILEFIVKFMSSLFINLTINF